MDSLNYQHLRYFWLTAREGNLTRASRRLGLSPSTVSAQIRQLEEMIGQELFDRRGRNLVLTEHGEIAKQYADDIFSLGTELLDAVRSQAGPRHSYRLRVGMSNNVPKLVASRFLLPAIQLPDYPVHLSCVEDRVDRLVADMNVHQIDLVLADSRIGLASDIHAESRLLGECGVSLAATPDLYRQYREDFPACLDDAPLLLPETGSAMRDLLESWFERAGLHPRVVAEFGDSALLKAFGQGGAGIVPIPAMVEREVERQYGLQTLGRLDGIVEQFYAIMLPSKLANPAVQAVLEAAQSTVGEALV